MAPSSSTIFEFVAPRVAADVPRLYVEARVAGLRVTHFKKHACKTFDGGAGGQPGVFRHIGELVWLKADRRWWVRAACDANAVELATLITTGLRVVREHGQSPGHWTRNKCFNHRVWDDGTRLAAAAVCYQVGVDDLIGAEPTVVDMEELVTLLLDSGGERDEVTR